MDKRNGRVDVLARPLVWYNHAMESSLVIRDLHLTPADVALLEKIAGDLGILADLCRSDLSVFCRASARECVVVAQALARSSSTVYESVEIGRRVSAGDEPGVQAGLQGKTRPTKTYTTHHRGATIARQVFPVYGSSGEPIAVLTKDAFWLAHERHLRRSPVFQAALIEFVEMALRGELGNAQDLTPFRGSDGIVYVGGDLTIRYMSGIATELYRRLGYRDSVVGRAVGELDTIDGELVAQAIENGACIERQEEQDGHTWERKVVPIVGRTYPLLRRAARLAFLKPPPGRPMSRGAFVLVHDATERLANQRAIEAKTVLVRDMHHRVKNNLQVIASIMSMQARRTKSAEARQVLEDSVARIMSVAVVHEFLSHNATGLINLREVGQRIVSQTQNSLIDPTKSIAVRLSGDDIWLPAERATQCALVINELVQNAIEHGMETQDTGHVWVSLEDDGLNVRIAVVDDGAGLSAGFDLERDANLGLQIVRGTVERDLRGTFELRPDDGNRETVALVRFAKPGGG